MIEKLSKITLIAFNCAVFHFYKYKHQIINANCLGFL